MLHSIHARMENKIRASHKAYLILVSKRLACSKFLSNFHFIRITK